MDEDPWGALNEGFRYRDLKTGAFITRDPLGFVGGPNLYTYVNQNPWTFFDPKGLEMRVYIKREYLDQAIANGDFAGDIAARKVAARRAEVQKAFASLEQLSGQIEYGGAYIAGVSDNLMMGIPSALEGESALTTSAGFKAGSSTSEAVEAASGIGAVKVLGKKAVKEVIETSLESSAKKIDDLAANSTTSRAARRQAMRDEGIPTSQQPTSQSQNSAGREYSYEVPQSGGGTQTKSVQQQTMDRSHEGQTHWEAGPVKTDPDTGAVRTNDYGRPKLENEKTKVEYNE